VKVIEKPLSMGLQVTGKIIRKTFEFSVREFV